MKFFSEVVATIIALPIVFVLIIGFSLWRTWWLYPAWGWYLQPLGLPAISFWHFAALSLLLTTLTHKSSTKKDDRKESSTLWLIGFCIAPITWAVLWWMHYA